MSYILKTCLSGDLLRKQIHCSPDKTSYTIALSSSTREIAAVSFRILVLSSWRAAGLAFSASGVLRSGDPGGQKCLRIKKSVVQNKFSA